MNGLVLDKMVRSCKDVQQIKGQFADGKYCIPLDKSKVFGFLFPFSSILCRSMPNRRLLFYVLFNEEHIDHNDI